LRCLKERSAPSLDDIVSVYKRWFGRQEVCSPCETDPTYCDLRNFGVVCGASSRTSSRRAAQFNLDLPGRNSTWLNGNRLHPQGSAPKVV